jgi:hypothetical protein
MKRLVAPLVVVVLLLSVMTGCAGSGSESASSTPTGTIILPMPTPPPSEQRCGDGVCDGPENPQNCPEDCIPVVTPPPDDGEGDQPQPPPGDQQATATPKGGSGVAATPPPEDEEPPPSTATEWEGNVDFTCEIGGEGGVYFWRAYIDFEFSVAPDGSISGSGSGEFFDDSCTIDCGACEFIELGPISAQVSGSREGELFHLSITPSAEMVARHVCNGVVDVPLMQLPACVSVPGGPTDFTIEARDNAWVEWQGTQEGIGGSIKGTGVSALYPK